MRIFILLVLFVFAVIPTSLAQVEDIVLEFSFESAVGNNIEMRGAGFGAFEPGELQFGDIPQDTAFDGATDGHGGILRLSPNEGSMIFGPLVTFRETALVRLHVQTDSTEVSLTLATIDQGDSEFVTTTSPNNPIIYLNQYRRITTLVVPPSDGFVPVFQVVNQSETEAATIYFDNWELFALQEDVFYSGEFLDSDPFDPERVRVEERDLPEATSTPVFGFETPTPSPTPFIGFDTPTPSPTSFLGEPSPTFTNTPTPFFVDDTPTATNTPTPLIGLDTPTATSTPTPVIGFDTPTATSTPTPLIGLETPTATSTPTPLIGP